MFLVAACTNGSTSASSATWTASVVTKAKAACEQRGGTTSTCDCAVVYLETHGYLAAGTAQQQSIMLDATNSCTPTTTSTAVTTTVAAPTTTVSPYTCQVTVGTPAGGGIATPGDMVNFYVESTDRDAAVTGTVTITNNGPGANAVVPLGSATTDGGGRTEYTYTVDSSAVGGADLLSMPPSVGPTALAACPCPERALSRGRQRSRARSTPRVVASRGTGTHRQDPVDVRPGAFGRRRTSDLGRPGTGVGPVVEFGVPDHRVEAGRATTWSTWTADSGRHLAVALSSQRTLTSSFI